MVLMLVLVVMMVKVVVVMVVVAVVAAVAECGLQSRCPACRGRQFSADWKADTAPLHLPPW